MSYFISIGEFDLDFLFLNTPYMLYDSLYYLQLKLYNVPTIATVPTKTFRNICCFHCSLAAELYIWTQ